VSVTTQRGLLGPSVIMAAGTVVSRITGFARAAMVAAALGLATVTADTFIVPTVIPTTLYILVGGGVLNSVLVPAMVRAIKEDADGGQAYSQRLFSLVVTVLGLATAAAVVAAPWIVRAFVDGKYLTPELRPYFDDMVLFARFCLPQIFFYGVYVLVGQMLNARGRFGPMMWAPILNNLVWISVLAA
jgi:peptidoglycan biosynthesis protein MviN/MurJ (putative lipid II flippase)